MTSSRRRFALPWLGCLVLPWTSYAQLSVPHVVKNSVEGCVRVRADHDTDASGLACLAAGAPVTVIGTEPYWREIAFGADQRGWIAKKFIEPASLPALDANTQIPSDAFLEVHFVDVGQGDAIWIQTHDDGIDGNGRFEGLSIVIDGGIYSSDTDNPFRGYIEDIGHHGAVVEALIVTHPHIDHYRGAETISRHFDINHYYDPGFPTTNSGYVTFLGAMRGTDSEPARAQVTHIGVDNFGDPDWGAEIDANFLYAWPGSNAGLGSGNTAVNNSSIVFRLQYGEHVFLFMGDAEGKDRTDDPDQSKYVEKILLDTIPEQLDATLLKIAHHGSETSSTLPWIRAVDPEIVVVQSGRQPFQGTFLPDSTTLQRYCAHNPDIRIYRTDQGDVATATVARDAVDDDHIVVRTNGTMLEVTAHDQGIPIEMEACKF